MNFKIILSVVFIFAMIVSTLASLLDDDNKIRGNGMIIFLASSICVTLINLL